MPALSLRRAGALAALLAALPVTQASAIPEDETLSVVTTLSGSGKPLPGSTVDAFWAGSPERDQLAISGRNLPGTTTTILASWTTGVRTVPRDGTVFRYEQEYGYDGLPAQAAATYAVTVTYHLAGSATWKTLYDDTSPYEGQAGLTTTRVDEDVRVWSTALAGKQVVVRWEAKVVLPAPVASYDATFTVG
jgi:hypothetical protein